MAMNWIILAAKDKDPKVHFPEKLAWELVDAATNQVCSLSYRVNFKIYTNIISLILSL
jgi:ribosomal protein S7